jgi:hypothetical protein
MLLNKPLAILAAVSVAACSKSSPETQPEPEMVSARVASHVEAPIARGDCKEATKRAQANPDLDVEKVAAPVALSLAPIGTRQMPKGVADRNGWYNVKFHVLVDAAGKPDMKTFGVDTASHAWLATNVKTAVSKWTFTPAEVAGCKIPRRYSLGISPKGKSPYVAPKPATKAPAKPTAKPAAKKPPAE